MSVQVGPEYAESSAHEQANRDEPHRQLWISLFDLAAIRPPVPQLLLVEGLRTFADDVKRHIAAEEAALRRSGSGQLGLCQAEHATQLALLNSKIGEVEAASRYLDRRDIEWLQRWLSHHIRGPHGSVDTAASQVV